MDYQQRKRSRENKQREVALPPSPATIPVLKPRIVGLRLVRAVDELLHYEEELHPPVFGFDTSEETAFSNYQKLWDNGFDLGKLVNGGKKSVLSYGSEFKPTRLLKQLLGRHPRWDAFKLRLDKGADFPLDGITEAARVGNLVGRLNRGNHKSAKQHHEFLEAALKKELAKGWLLPLPASRAMHIPEMEMAPMGVAVHVGITADGRFHEKE